MNRFPLLEQMRAAREAREASVVAPFVDALRTRDQEAKRAWSMAYAMEAELIATKRAFMQPFAGNLRDAMADDIARNLIKCIDRAILIARGKGSWDAEVTVPINLMEHADNKSIVRYVTDYYLQHMEVEANVRRHRASPEDASFEVQRLEISIPTVACSRTLMTTDPSAPSYTKGQR